MQLKIILGLSKEYSQKSQHSIKELWHEVKGQFPRWHTYFERIVNDAFEVLLLELDWLDPHSLASRYVETLPKKGQAKQELFAPEWAAFVPLEWKDIPSVSRYLYVDLEHLENSVGKMSRFLDGLYEAIP